MSSIFTRFWGSQEQEQEPPQQHLHQSSSMSYTSSSSSSSRPSHVPPAEAAGVIAALKDKSVDELRKISSEKDAYQRFLQSLEQVKIQNNLKDELCKENMLLVDENLQKEPRVLGLKNQCRIIRTSELAAAQEKLKELEKQKEEMLKLSSLPFLLHRIQGAMNKAEEESENLHQQLLDKEIDLGAFLQKYKKLRIAYHSKNLIHLAARTSNI
ncbi:vacuolar protein-sorting-associated protein 37 homolog 2-like [Arachis stenosperma]|uniref:vacuolar protein-sorting-associated protein 37 homolog 2-like n=1 Tax=Arachis stenosperma TaxID=217475 RepID=UPI0025AC4745|nr:vacuolar protein-sorting-associated protein 37 homolog 2-like [Arachis stenosperma]